jgi:predicted nuclease of predicted toxin-antitoxin system
MKFKIDENLPVEVANLLRSEGHDAVTVYEEHLAGKPDVDIASISNMEERAVITLDNDFCDIRVYPPSEHRGIIVLRVVHQDKTSVLALLHRLVPLVAKETVDRRLWIVEETQVRIRE